MQRKKGKKCAGKKQTGKGSFTRPTQSGNGSFTRPTQSGGRRTKNHPKSAGQQIGMAKLRKRNIGNLNVPVGASPELIDMIQNGNGIGSSIASGIKGLGSFLSKNPGVVSSGLDLIGGITQAGMTLADRNAERELLRRQMLGLRK